MKPIPELDSFGILVERFLHLLPDGRIVVKDGRALEEYINDPRLVARRKEVMDRRSPSQPIEMVLVNYERSLIGFIPRIS